jgi:hypothetical protein
LLQYGKNLGHCHHVGSSAISSLVPPRSLMFFSPGILPRVRATETTSLILCALDRSFLSRDPERDARRRNTVRCPGCAHRWSTIGVLRFVVTRSLVRRQSGKNKQLPLLNTL